MVQLQVVTIFVLSFSFRTVQKLLAKMQKQVTPTATTSGVSIEQQRLDFIIGESSTTVHVFPQRPHTFFLIPQINTRYQLLIKLP
jgi:hypothetical protein